MQLKKRIPKVRSAQRWTALLVICSFSLPACSEPEVYNPMVEISNVELTRPEENVLRITLDYELAPEFRIPLPYKEIVVSPLEPQAKILVALEEFILSVDTVIVKMGIPPEAGLDWEDVSDEEQCCIVSLKGLVEEGGKSRYERISNELRVLPPQLSE
jgi:hypothetical protein